MAKKRSKSTGKVRKPGKEPKPKTSERKDEEAENGAQDFGGMNFDNFRKNLGCG